MRVPIGGGRWLRFGRHPVLDRAAGAAEPRSLAVSGSLRERSAPGTRLVASVEDRRSALLGALVLERAATNRWNALPLVLDPRAAGPLAFLVDHSPAGRVFGTPAHVEPLLPHLSRVSGQARVPFFANRLVDPVRPVVDPRTRVAGLGDVPAVVDVLATYAYLALPSPRSTRRFVERAIERRLAVVVEVEGRVVGVALGDAPGRDYLYLADLAVHPDFRGLGLAWPLFLRFADVAVELGFGVCASLADTNPMHVAPHATEDDAGTGVPIDEWVAVRLRPRRRLGPPRWRDRQVRRAHRLVDAAELRWTAAHRPPGHRRSSRHREGRTGSRLRSNPGGAPGVAPHPVPPA